jgi:hypothetical protein
LFSECRTLQSMGAESNKQRERGSQDSNLESPVLETGALASLATAPWAPAMLTAPLGAGE